MATIAEIITKKVQYRYTCEVCGHETEWFNSSISLQYLLTKICAVGVPYRCNPWEWEDITIKSNKTLNDLYNNPAKGKLIEGFKQGNACPKCGKPQSWAEPLPGIHAIGRVTMFLFFCFMALLLMMNLSTTLFTVLGFIGFINLIVPFIIYRIRVKRRKAYGASLPERHKPEIKVD